MRAWRDVRGFTLLEVLAAVLVISIGFAGALGWLQGHGKVLSNEMRSMALKREARNTYERAMAFPQFLVDSTWDYQTQDGKSFRVRLDVLDSLDVPDSLVFRSWPREALLTFCDAQAEENCPVRLFFAVGGLNGAP